VNEVAAGTPTCGPFGESNLFTTASGQVVNGTRTTFGPDFGSVDWLTTIGNGNYNALQLTVRHVSRSLELQAGYTFAKSLDNSSSISEQLNPLNYRSTYAPSAFDIKHDLVVSCRYELITRQPYDESIFIGQEIRFRKRKEAPFQPRLVNSVFSWFPCALAPDSCSVGEPASASPASAHFGRNRLRGTVQFQRTTNSVLTVCLTSGDKRDRLGYSPRLSVLNSPKGAIGSCYGAFSPRTEAVIAVAMAIKKNRIAPLKKLPYQPTLLTRAILRTSLPRMLNPHRPIAIRELSKPNQ
jgi:hypothetical protein